MSLPAKKKAEVYQAIRIIRLSTHQGKNHVRYLDYRQAIKWSGGPGKNVWTRRRTVRGWILAGGRVTHTNRAELRRIQASMPGGDLTKREPVDRRFCQGSNKIVRFRPALFNFVQYFDSCATGLIILVLGSAAATIGVIGAFTAWNPALAPWTLVCTVVAAVLAIAAAFIDYLARTSALGAIRERVRYPFGWYGRQ